MSFHCDIVACMFANGQTARQTPSSDSSQNSVDLHVTKIFSMPILDLIIDTYLLSAGIIQNRKLQKYQNPLFACLVIVNITLIFSMYQAFTQTTKLTYRILLISYTVGSSTGFMLQVCSFLNKRHVIALITTIREDKSRYTNNSTVKDTYKKFIPLLYPILALLIMTGLVFMLPAVSFFLTENPDYNNPDFYMLMNVFAYWQVTSAAGMLLRNNLQIICLIPGSLTFFCGFLFMVYITADLQAHSEEICRQYAQTVRDFHADSKNKVVDKLFCSHLHRIIKYQQYFNRYLKTFMFFMEWTSHIWWFWFMSGTILIIYVLLQVEHDDITFVIKNFAIAVDVPLQFYLCCKTSHIITHLNEYFLESFYTTSWYMLTPKLRKSLNFMMLNSQHSKKIKLLNMYVVDSAFFAKCLRISYSVLNVLLCVRRK